MHRFCVRDMLAMAIQCSSNSHNSVFEIAYLIVENSGCVTA